CASHFLFYCWKCYFQSVDQGFSTGLTLGPTFSHVRGLKLGRCHIVEDILGEGGFGIVTKCQNMRTKKIEAIKVNRSAPEEMQMALHEISYMKRLQCLDADACNIVKWNGYFFHEESICMNLELLDQNLIDYLDDRGNPGLPVTEIRPVLHQLATALFHLHSIGVVHLDLKPENVMVVDRTQQPVRVKIIDFGLASLLSEIQVGDYRGTNMYMAPEMMLAAPFDETHDMWSLGVIAAELAMGSMLYPGETDYDVLSCIIETQGQPPDDVLNRGMQTSLYFHCQRNKRQPWRLKSPEEFQRDSGLHPEDSRDIQLTCLDDIALLSLIKSMLHLDPGQRVKAREALQHPFFAPGVQPLSVWFLIPTSRRVFPAS
uniref:Protein kinase domain-containing protein n=1 Tax=Stegastes partitus TaxID=144197 RepID=A0A3B5ANA1_9TELE